jgi:hypothetical protein
MEWRWRTERYFWILSSIVEAEKLDHGETSEKV